jgi:hypothetical protein
MTLRPTNPGRETNLTRLAWLVSIATPVLLIALLGAAKAAAVPAAGVPTPDPVAEAATEEECVEWEEGEIECEAEEAEEAETGPLPPEECLLRTAQARVVSGPTRNRLRLVVRYTTSTPTRAYLDFALRNGGGSLDLGVVRRHLGRSGVLRLHETLGTGEMERARDASDYLLTLDIPSAPSYCQQYFSRRLDLKRTAHGQTAWSQSSQASGPAR